MSVVILDIEYCPRVVLVYIFVVSLNETVQLKLGPDDTVRMVKLKIRQQLKIPLSEQMLVYAGLELEDEHKLFEYSIQRNSTLQLLICKRWHLHLAIYSPCVVIYNIACILYCKSYHKTNMFPVQYPAGNYYGMHNY